MAKVYINKTILENLVFGFSEHKVDLMGGEYDPECEAFVFEIEGEDVPKTNKRINMTLSLRQNRAGQTFVEAKFEEIKWRLGDG